MKNLYNEERHKNEWTLNRWYEKTAFVVGVIYVSLMALAFTLAFVAGFLGALFE